MKLGIDMLTVTRPVTESRVSHYGSSRGTFVLENSLVLLACASHMQLVTQY